MPILIMNLKDGFQKEFVLPKYGSDYMLLVPKDIVVREELWINKEDMLESFEQIPIAISNLELRDTLSNFYYQSIATSKEKRWNNKRTI